MTTYWLFMGLNVTHYDNCASPIKATTLEPTTQSLQQLYTNTVISQLRTTGAYNIIIYLILYNIPAESTGAYNIIYNSI